MESSINSRCKKKTARMSKESSDEDSLMGLICGRPDDFENLGYSSDGEKAESSSSSPEDDEPAPEENMKKARSAEMELEKQLRMAREARIELEKKNRLQKNVGKKSRPAAERRVVRQMSSENAATPTLCPVPMCTKGFENRANVRRHMMKVHKLSKADMAGFKIVLVSTKCPHCDTPQTNLSRHLKESRCKSKRAEDSLRVDPVGERDDQEPFGPHTPQLQKNVGKKSRPAAERRVVRQMSSENASTSSLCPVPMCTKGFENLQNVRRHMSKVHKLSKADIAGFKIVMVSKQCPHCDTPQTNLPRHLKENRCKAKRVEDSLRVEPVGERDDQKPFGPQMEALVKKKGGDPEPAQVQDITPVEPALEPMRPTYEGGDPEPAQVQDIAPVEPALEPRRPAYEGGDPEPAPQDQDTADDDDVVLGDEGGDPEPAQVQDIAPVEPALEPRRPTFISDEFKECLRTVFEELPGKVTSQQIKGKIQENRELQTYWEEFLQVNKSESKAVDTVKKFLGGSRQVSKGYMDPAIENSLWALLTPDSVLTTKALVKRAAEDEQFKVVWDHFRSRRKTASDAAKWLRRTFLRKP